MGTWWYNTESGALTNAGSIQSFFQQVQGDLGIGAGWHKLNIPGSDTAQQAASDAQKEYPSGAPPTTNVAQQAQQEAGQITGLPTGFFGAVEVFLTALTDGKMWRSLGWLALGLVLFIAGVWLWIGRDAHIPVVL